MFGISRQGLYKRSKSLKEKADNSIQVCQVVKSIREFTPRMGTRKVYDLIKDGLAERGVKIGRDRLFDILRSKQMLVPRRKKHFFTTDSKHRFYKHPNLIKGLEITKPEQVWVSDITYIKTREGNMYLSLITDAYSRMIVGWHLANHLRASGPIEALKMALVNRRYPDRKLIHHSDKGIQYCCDDYTEMLRRNKITISMTSKYDPYENAIAERVNGTIKNEFELDCVFPDGKYARRELSKTITIYNTLRPHLSCQMHTPMAVHYYRNPNVIKHETKHKWESLIFNNFHIN